MAKNQQRGRSMIEASATCGFPMAIAYCLTFGWNGKEKDMDKAYEMFVKIDPYHWAQDMLGVCCRCGFGTSQDYTKAVAWFTKASEQGNSCAMNNLGYLYQHGHGCDQNHTKAVELFAKSANLGYSVAMCSLANCYEEGRGVTKNANQARAWLTKALAQGDETAQHALGRLTRAPVRHVLEDDDESPHLEELLRQMRRGFEASPPIGLQGWSIDDILNMVTLDLSYQELKLILLELRGEGAVYSTIDDDHYLLI